MKIISATYIVDDANDERTRRVLFVFSEGEGNWNSYDYRFPRPGWPVVPLQTRIKMPNLIINGIDPNGKKESIHLSTSTTDPIVVNVVMQAIEDLDNGTFINKRQVWPIEKI